MAFADVRKLEMRYIVYLVPVAAVAGAWLWSRPVAPSPPENSGRRSLAIVSPVTQTTAGEETNGADGVSLPARPTDESLEPPFVVKVHIRRIFTGWQRLDLAEGEIHRKGLRSALRREVEAIKTRLYSDGLFTEGALRKQMLRAAEELGYRPEEARFVVNRSLALAKADKESETPELESAAARPGRRTCRLLRRRLFLEAFRSKRGLDALDRKFPGWAWRRLLRRPRLCDALFRKRSAAGQARPIAVGAVVRPELGEGP